MAVAFRLGVLVSHEETDVPPARRPNGVTHLPPHGPQPLAAGMAGPAAAVARRTAH
ncbi:MAG TPA: hypothetical protein VJX10_15685 [Pseudonocardiaceae bacterium]|nr:hypothetical protein [Pseudonocardiaceae bacterium]